jgi:hypothetical protein
MDVFMVWAWHVWGLQMGIAEIMKRMAFLRRTAVLL